MSRKLYKFFGSIIDNCPAIEVLFEVPAFRCSRIIIFRIDTGSDSSAITEKEANLLGLDCNVLPESKREAIGFGGTFKNKIINYPVFLTLKYLKDEYKITYSSGFQIICIPPKVTSEEREKILRYTPSVLGMDILRAFQLYVDKKKVELTRAS